MPVRRVRSAALAASIVALVGVCGCTPSDDEPAAEGAATSAAPPTDAPSTDAAPATDAGTTDPSGRGLSLDVDAGGPYEGSSGSALLLSSNIAVSGQADTTADLGAIGAALVAYRDEHGSYPPAFLTDDDGTPMVSWRVLLLPYLGESELYAQFDLTKPWDDPANEPLIEQIPDVYASDAADATTARLGDTAYAGVGGAKTVFRDGAADLGGGMPTSSVTDGDTMTIAVGPVGPDVAVPWTSPIDVDTNEHPSLGDPAGFAGPGGPTTPMLFLDGTVRTFANDIDPEIVSSWSTVAGDSCSPPAGLALQPLSGWDFDGDGEFDAYGSTVEFPTDEAGEYEVLLAVDDGLGGIHEVTTTVTVK